MREAPSGAPEVCREQAASESALASRVEVVAELTTNHFGDRWRLEEMVVASALAGADLVKVQRRDVDTFYSRAKLSSPYDSPFGNTFGDYRRRLELTDADFDFLDLLCKELGIRWFASALDIVSFDYLLARGCPLIKIPSTVSTHDNLLEHASSSPVDIVFSTGMSSYESVSRSVRLFDNAERIYLLQCTSAYPTSQEDCNVGVVRTYRDLAKDDPRIIPGYSSHDSGSFGSALAVAAGARMVEKHVKLGRTPWAHFDEVALDLTTDSFVGYVAAVRDAETVCGSEGKTVLRSEHHKYAQSGGQRR